MASVTDWGKRGQTGFARDPANEQTIPLAAGASFVGQWTRVDQVVMFAVLYGTHVPFTLRIEWSKDGVTQDTDPFATTSPQVRNRLGLYSVISFQSTFFRPWFRVKVINGPSPQLFAIADVLLMKSIFPGYLIDVDGPIPVLGLAALNHGLGWGRTPTDWQPLQLTALKNQKIALAENLLGNLPVTVSNPTANPETGLAKDATLAAVLAAVVSLNPVGTARRVNTVGATLVKTGPGVLKRVIVGGVGTTTNITIYDSLTASGPVLGTVRAIVNTGEVYPFDVAFTVGLTVSCVAATDLTVVYQ